MAVMPRVEQPKIEIERKIGNTTYIVNGFFASQGVTVSKRIIRVLDKVLGSGEINHSGSGEKRQFWSNENHQSGVASPQVVLFTRPAAGQPVSQ